MPVNPADIAAAALEAKLVTKRKLTRAEKKAKEQGTSLFDVLVIEAKVDKHKLGEAMASFFGLPYADLDKVAGGVEQQAEIPPLKGRGQKLIVFRCEDDDGVCIASDNPSKNLEKQLSKKLARPVRVFYSDTASIDALRSRDNTSEFREFAESMEKVISKGTRSEDAEDLPVITIVDEILKFAYFNKTSDIHIEPYDEKTVVRFRIDGLLHDVIELPKHLHELIIARIKILSYLRTDEHRAAQDGKLRFPYFDETVDARVSIVPIVRGEKVVLRLLADKSQRLDLESLGFRPEDLEKIERSIHQPWGMILATGPTGSGKTTTLYAVLKKLNRREINISTIEDPVEYDMEGINQIQVNTKTDLTFAKGLRSIVRQDPDIIMVGEIRDEETASIAVNSAMTGHLVLSTLHTNDAATTLPRLLDMGVQSFLVGTTVNISIAQRLVRKLCSSCSVKGVVDKNTKLLIKQELSAELIRKYKLLSPSLKLTTAKGCADCQKTGYSGRLGIYELMEVDDDIKRLVMEKATANTIKKRAVQKGMLPMLEDGIQKVLAGVTTIDEILRVSKE